MKISGTHTFHAPRERVWRALLDPAILSTVLPGCERLKQSAENEFEGAIDLIYDDIPNNLIESALYNNGPMARDIGCTVKEIEVINTEVSDA